jgi:hypothetical protein
LLRNIFLWPSGKVGPMTAQHGSVMTVPNDA